MARKYAYMNGRHFAWGMEICEERLLIAGYHQIEQRIRPGERWPLEFKEHFYHCGQGVSERFLAQLNQEFRRCGSALFAVEETAIFDYGSTTDRSWKAKARQEIRDEYLGLPDGARAEWIAEARADVELLPPPAISFAEHSQRVRAKGELSPKERSNREEALRAVQPAPSPQPMPNFERAIRVMNLATDEATIDLIMRSITSDEALLIAESGRITNPTLHAGLIQRSVEPIVRAAPGHFEKEDGWKKLSPPLPRMRLARHQPAIDARPISHHPNTADLIRLSN